MKVLATSLAALVVFVSSANAAAPVPAAGAANESEARRGCCSHHGGVCGCGGDTLRCCDGTDSPTCEC